VDLDQELAALVDALDRELVPYALCGALALAVHGVPRATRDIDVLARPEDLEKFEEVARGCGFTLKALKMRFAGTNVEVRRLSKIVGGRPLTLDILVVNDSLEAVWKDRESRPWRQGRLSVVSKEGLVALKLTAGRAQDHADIERLQALDDEED